ncbi:tRNA1(Val) (adenine(37)-N6)-methyltransferase [Desulfovibrio ferrophilus]|uniref:Methyltransferase small n=1 Tax=Desulfovibrio ferrophilus TaxID=241368 RepID=A0A2Z6B036_9BACT|nr:methyltransferase [Desulfovibrio ferrophilus]BBD08813.1 methyltransferase small [Desulfovibrio ferrophilus]
MNASQNPDILSAREYFPRGMSQPESGFRFSMDALLLACFAPVGGAAHAVDLGCGCGVVGQGWMLRQPEADPVVTGLDVNPQMLDCAAANAVSLGLEDRYAVVRADVSAVRIDPDLSPESCDLVLCNPPYREPGTGRRPADHGRDTARFEAVAPIAAFVEAASYLLKNRKRACFIGLPERLPELLTDMLTQRLAPKRLLLVHSRVDEPARLALVEAVKNGGPGLVVEPPLVVYQGQGAKSCLTPQALEYCPFLVCNG